MKATIICGPQASGKSTMAIEIAKAAGSYAVIDQSDFMSDGFNAHWATKDTVIVEECNVNACVTDAVKELLSSGKIQVRASGRWPRLHRAPRVILVSNTFSNVNPGWRRFHVIRLGREAA